MKFPRSSRISHLWWSVVILRLAAATWPGGKSLIWACSTWFIQITQASCWNSDSDHINTTRGLRFYISIQVPRWCQCWRVSTWQSWQLKTTYGSSSFFAAVGTVGEVQTDPLLKTVVWGYSTEYSCPTLKPLDLSYSSVLSLLFPRALLLSAHSSQLHSEDYPGAPGAASAIPPAPTKTQKCRVDCVPLGQPAANNWLPQK